MFKSCEICHVIDNCILIKTESRSIANTFGIVKVHIMSDVDIMLYRFDCVIAHFDCGTVVKCHL